MRKKVDCMDWPLIVGIVGEVRDGAGTYLGSRHAGKSTVAERVVELLQKIEVPVTKMSMADPVKEIARDVFGWNGKKDDKGRRLLQVVGTDAGRSYNENIWVEKATLKVKQLANPTGIVVFDDIRFFNEANWIMQSSGLLIKLTREVPNVSAKRPDIHASERKINGVEFDLIVMNMEGNPDFACEHVYQWLWMKYTQRMTKG